MLVATHAVVATTSSLATVLVSPTPVVPTTYSWVATQVALSQLVVKTP
jgi:hypothetical protein